MMMFRSLKTILLVAAWRRGASTKVLSLPGAKNCAPSDAALAELRRLVGEDYRVRDIFEARCLNVILEK
jgi:hypothetical protein